MPPGSSREERHCAQWTNRPAAHSRQARHGRVVVGDDAVAGAKLRDSRPDGDDLPRHLVPEDRAGLAPRRTSRADPSRRSRRRASAAAPRPGRSKAPARRRRRRPRTRRRERLSRTGLSVRREPLAPAHGPTQHDREHQRHRPLGGALSGARDRAARCPLPRPSRARLAGERGEAIARTMPAFRSGLWPMVVRTCVFDELVLRAAGGGIRHGREPRLRTRRAAVAPDAAAGRAGSTSICPRSWPTRARSDRRAAGLRALPGRGGPARRARAAGLLRADRAGLAHARPHRGVAGLPERAEVLSLATDLHAPRSFRWWASTSSPSRSCAGSKRWAKSFAAGRAKLQFAPAERDRFFRPAGWKEIEFRSTWDESRRLRREMRMAWLWRLLGPPRRRRGREKIRRMGGIAVLERT